MLTWSTASNKETFYLFGLWQTSKWDTKGIREGRSDAPFQAGTPEPVFWYLTAMSSGMGQLCMSRSLVSPTMAILPH